MLYTEPGLGVCKKSGRSEHLVWSKLAQAVLGIEPKKKTGKITKNDYFLFILAPACDLRGWLPAYHRGTGYWGVQGEFDTWTRSFGFQSMLNSGEEWTCIIYAVFEKLNVSPLLHLGSWSLHGALPWALPGCVQKIRPIGAPGLVETGAGRVGYRTKKNKVKIKKK